MKKEIEEYLWNQLPTPSEREKYHNIYMSHPDDERAERARDMLVVPREIIDEMLQKKMIKSRKQALATLHKWARKGWIDYGTNIESGWRTK